MNEQILSLLQDVQTMRKHQRDWFVHKMQYDLRESKRYENIVDEKLRRLSLPDKVQSNQGKLL